MGLILGALTKKTRNMKSVFMCPWRRKDVMRSHTKIYKELCNLVERIKKSEWKRSDIDFEEDVQSLKNLKMQEKNILLMTARFFLTVNSMVMDSFNNSLLKDLEELSSKNELLIKAIEFYNEQNRQEQVHDEFYKDIGKIFAESSRSIRDRFAGLHIYRVYHVFPFFTGIIFHRFKGNIRETVAGNYCVCNEEAMHVLGHSHIYKHVGGITKLRAREMCDELVCLVKDMWSSSIFCFSKNNVNGFTLKMIHSYIDDLSEYML
ncbi:25803_t:CDS:2 [Gigaspora rosea]|nr:25803_t:CDS:2 [Gigaspora rosea]